MSDGIGLALDIVTICGIAGSYILQEKRIGLLKEQLSAQAKWIETATGMFDKQAKLNDAFEDRLETLTDIIIDVDDEDDPLPPN